VALDKDQICELLGAGLDISVVANAVGCTPTYIGQLLSEDDFASRVTELRTKNLQGASKRDEKINNLEDAFLDKLDEVKDLLYKPRDVLQAVNTLNRMQRRGVPAEASLVAKQPTVHLNIPQILVQQNFLLNNQGEVVEVDGRTMVSMPAHQLLRNLQKVHQGNDSDAGRYKKVANYLAGPAIEQGSGGE
jgi:hypothetical protein